MIIKKIEIDNFRSYYKHNEFEFINGFNLIIGANGDGKTTLFEALEWLFNTADTKKTDVKYVSKKRSDELDANTSDKVRVAVTYDQDGSLRLLEKSFSFTKSFDGEISCAKYEFLLTKGNGIERTIVDGKEFERDFPTTIRKYSMFKGESDLDVFQQSNSLKQLIETFSDIKDFESYFKLMTYSTEKAERARDHAQKQDRKNAGSITRCKRTIESEKNIIDEIDQKLSDETKEATNFDMLLKNIEESKEASELLKNVNNRIDQLTKNRIKFQSQLSENYSINLLDNLWILMGFNPIAQQYTQKINALDLEKRKQDQRHTIKFAKEKEREKIQTAFTPLPAHIPGPEILQEMLNEQVCKVCGRKAEKHSEPWEFMAKKLQEYYDSLKPEDNENEEDDIVPPLFVNNYIGELQKKDTTLTDNLDSITKLHKKISDIIAFNNRIHNDIKKLDENIENEFEKKKRILAQTDGLTEEQLLANYNNISSWSDKRRTALNKIEFLKRNRIEHVQKLETAQAELSKMAEGTDAEVYAKVFEIINQIQMAFKSAKETNKKRLMMDIEDKANHYLESLNSNDFKGTIRIIEKTDGQAAAVLTNSDGTRIFNPNTALRTTYLMSVLFAIGKLSSDRQETELPLIFDAPTSSFTEAKESEFFDVISSFNKQVIIVTKSFLKDEGNGKLKLDRTKVNGVNGNVYRIQKKEPFDDKNLGTIQTVISKVK